ncbi:MAG: aconitate hydratase AcnA [Clostridia bacterium]|nr:aconitate hydratase AcnA [Clostridia bacterium]
MRDRPLPGAERLETAMGGVYVYRLDRLEREGVVADVGRLPYALRVFLENAYRHAGRVHGALEAVFALAAWDGQAPSEAELPFMPARVILQDFTGVPAIVDLAAMRDAMAAKGGDPARINPLIPADLVIDHSVQVDMFGTTMAFEFNVKREYERNHERYAFLRWAQKSFRNFTVVPPGTGIVHQVNLEYLAKVVWTKEEDGRTLAFPDTLLGTDSHTTMVNGLGVLGWGVGGIEAEAVMLGEPYNMLIPEVVGVRLTGELREGATATDLVLTVTEMLRKKGVVGKIVEYFGPGLGRLPIPDRATIGNMSPEYGATAGFFPIDEQTLTYLRQTGRPPELVAFVERYAKEQRLFRDESAPEPRYSDVLELDMGTVEPSVAGPKLPQQRLPLPRVAESFRTAFDGTTRRAGDADDGRAARGERGAVATLTRTGVRDGDVVIAAITSCTNTSNPSVMVAAGLLARNAVRRGLRVPAWVKTSLAPGSRVVTDYLKLAGLMGPLAELGFELVGYGCTTCIGNSGSLIDEVAREVQEQDLAVVAVLSGNRNFEGRINPLVRANYLASPPLVVAYALAGTIDVDLTKDPLGTDGEGRPVYLADIWPSQDEVAEVIERSLDPDMFRREYAHVFDGDDRWRSLPVPSGELYAWSADSTYVRRPPYFDGMPDEPLPLADIEGARVLALLGDSVTTDHISPAGAIPKSSPAGRYLLERGVGVLDFNTYGARRGNDEVMVRGTFANIRLRNRLAPGTEGGFTRHMPSGEEMTIFEAAERYRAEGVPLLVIAGREYGTGSSRDWAAKGTRLLGVRAVIAESYERIHRSNLVGMGVLPLEFRPGDSAASLGLDGSERYSLTGIRELRPRGRVLVRAEREGGGAVEFETIARLDTPVELEYYRHGGILLYVLRRLARADGAR